MGMIQEVGKLGTAAAIIGTVAAVTLTSIAVVGGFKDTGLVDNTTGDQFINGLKIFGSFAGVVAIALIGVTIVKMFMGKDSGMGSN